MVQILCIRIYGALTFVLSQPLIRGKPLSAISAPNADSVKVVPDKSITRLIFLPIKISRTPEAVVFRLTPRDDAAT